MQEHCKEGQARIIQHEADVNAARAQQETFCACGVELDQVDVFKYLGRSLASDDNANQAMQSNL